MMIARTVPRKAMQTVSHAREMVLRNPANPVNWGGRVRPMNLKMLPSPLTRGLIPKPISCQDTAKKTAMTSVPMNAPTRRRVHGGLTEREIGLSVSSPGESVEPDRGGRPPRSVTG